MRKKNLNEFKADDRFLLIKFDKAAIKDIVYYKDVVACRKGLSHILTHNYSYDSSKQKIDPTNYSFDQIVQSIHQYLNYSESDFRILPFIIRDGEVFPL